VADATPQWTVAQQQAVSWLLDRVAALITSGDPPLGNA